MARPNLNFNTFVPEDLQKSTIDWGAVTTGLTAQLTKIKKDREEKRSEFEDKTYENTRKLRDLEQYDNPTLNSLVIDASGSAQEYLKTQNQMFKNGLISQSEYTKAMDRISGNFADFSKAAKNYDKSYQDYEARIAADPSKNYLGSSKIEQDFAEGALAFGNLKGLVEYVNPATGEISLVRPNEDGTIPTDPSKHIPFSGMNNRMNFRQDIYNVGQIQKGIVDSLGTTIQSTGTIDDATIFTETATASLDKYVDSMMVKNLDVASVLVDTKGGYYTTTDLNDTNPNAIHINYSNNNQPSIIEGERWDKQKGVAQEYLKERMTDMIDNKAKAIRTKFEPASASQGRNDKEYDRLEQKLPVYTSPVQVGGTVQTGIDYLTKGDDSLGKFVGGDPNIGYSSDTDAEIQDRFFNVTKQYIPTPVKQHFGRNPLLVQYFDEVKTVDNGDGTFSNFYIDYDGTRVKMKDNQMPGSTQENPIPNSFSSKEDAEAKLPNMDRKNEFMTIEFGGINYTIPNIRGRRTDEVWISIQENVINQAVDRYNDDMYREVYGNQRPVRGGGGAGSRYNTG